MNVKAVFGVVAGALVSCHCFAVHLDMKPGLWEHTFKLSGGSLGSLQQEQQQQMQQAMIEMKKRFADMPPEQRQQLEALMKQNGIEVDTSALLAADSKVQLSKDGTLVKECVTQAQIDKGELPAPEKSCKNTVVQKSSNVFKVTYQCSGSSQAHGTAEVTFQNPKSYTGKASYSLAGSGSSLGGSGGGQTMEGTMSGKWLSSDCGSVKPELDDGFELQE